MSRSLKCSWFIDYRAVIAATLDFILLVIAIYINDHFSRGDLFAGAHAYILGILALPLAICGAGLSVFGLIYTPRLKKLLPLLGLIFLYSDHMVGILRIQSFPRPCLMGCLRLAA